MPPDFREALPPQCPPATADEITKEVTVYRLVASKPPTEQDFKSQRELMPKAKFQVDECRARGLSV